MQIWCQNAQLSKAHSQIQIGTFSFQERTGPAQADAGILRRLHKKQASVHDRLKNENQAMILDRTSPIVYFSNADDFYF